MTLCTIVAAVVTCMNVAPAPAADAAATFTASTAPYTPPAPVPFVVPDGWKYVGPIRGEVFSDFWPYASAWRPRRMFPSYRFGDPWLMGPVAPGTFDGDTRRRHR
jgi:hypothetical protein